MSHTHPCSACLVTASPSAVEMFTFNSPKVVDKWHVFSDAFFGGRSQAALVYNAEEQVGWHTAGGRCLCGRWWGR